MTTTSDYRIVLCEGRTLRSLGAKRWWSRIESTVNGQTIYVSEVYASRQKRDQTAERFGQAADLRVTEAAPLR